MNKKIFAVIPVICLTLASCGVSETSAETPKTVTVTVSEPVNDGIVKLTEGYEAVSDGWEISDGWTNGSMFNCTWRKTNCIFGDVMQLKIDNDALSNGNIPYSGAEFRSKDHYGYGYYETEMKPIKNNGAVSSFFTYTGPTDGDPWDEIDIEFLGKDTTKVQFNYFTDGKGDHEYLYDLGFDASEDFHKYGFEWREDGISWYVDGEKVYTASENIPTTPGKIMMNVWPGTGVDSWLSPFDGTVPLTAEYIYVKYTDFVQ